MRPAECYGLVQSQRIARLGCCRDDQPYVVPIHYAFLLNRFFSFSMPGQKIDTMRNNPKVCVEIEHFSGDGNWKCVVCDGIFHELTSEAERQTAWESLQTVKDWWEPGSLKPAAQPLTDKFPHVFYEVVINKMTGRIALPG
jgi:hypothetical protein